MACPGRGSGWRGLRLASMAMAALVQTGCRRSDLELPPPPADAEQRGADAGPSGGRVAVLVGAGDIANCAQLQGAENTAVLVESVLAGGGEVQVFTAGDNAYEKGSAANYLCYDATWGRFKAQTRPAVGNHEYETAAAEAYFDYFGDAGGERGKGYYSYDLGEWHVVVLNSSCTEAGGCGAGSPQELWLRADLAANPAKCTAAYWHYPRFSSGEHGPTPAMHDLFRALYEANADVVLAGHDHLYERFAAQDPEGLADPVRGIRQFVVGTGGKSHYRFRQIQPNSEVRDAQTFGVLKLTLRPTGYDWEFLPEPGGTFRDRGSEKCH